MKNVLEQNIVKPIILPPVSQPPLAQTPKPAKQFYSGTGFMFGGKDYVITNWHVIRSAKNIKVKFLNGEKINAEVLLKDVKIRWNRQTKNPGTDLA